MIVACARLLRQLQVDLCGLHDEAAIVSVVRRTALPLVSLFGLPLLEDLLEEGRWLVRPLALARALDLAPSASRGLAAKAMAAASAL